MIKRELSILIPTYNEAKYIKSLFFEFDKIIKKNDYKFYYCFVDDSKDNKTKTEIEKYFPLNNTKIIRSKNKKNYSSRCKASWKGFKWLLNNVDSPYIVEFDADLAHHPKDLPRGLRKIINEKADLLIFSKYHSKSKVIGRPLLRTFISFIYTMTCRIFFSFKITDYTNSYRIFTKSSLQKLTQQDLEFDSPIQHLENVLFYLKNNYKIIETHSEYIESKKWDSTVKIKDYGTYIFQLTRCIFKNFFTKY